MNNVIDLFQKGGFAMYPLLLCSIIALAIVIEKFYSLSRAQINSKKLIEKAKNSIAEANFPQAVGICEATPGPVARVLSTAIKLHDLPVESIEDGVKEAVLSEVPRLEKLLPTLSTIVTVAPLLGLLGTITGLMKLFNVIAGGGIGDSTALASGIAEALITTATGLIIAIPTLTVYNYFATKVDSIIHDMEKAVAELLNFIKLRGEKDGI